jgi:hypothetical protein
MRPVLKTIASMLASGALVASSTAAAAAAPETPAPAAQVQPQAPNAWLALSAMSSTRAIALGGANSAAQPADQPPPPPPPGYVGGPVINGEIIAFGLWFALIIIALTISGESGRPNSPA